MGKDGRPMKTPAQRHLDHFDGKYGEPSRFTDLEEIGDFGNPGRIHMEHLLEPDAKGGPASRMGPLEKVHAFWFAGMSCDGCTVSVVGSSAPSVEGLLLGAHPGIPRIVLHHPVVNLESGHHYLHAAEKAVRGELDAPYVIILEGSVTDETKAQETDGFWAGNGEVPWTPEGEERTITADEWIARLAPGAAASIAIGTCATWGGIPSSEGNPTGSMSLMDFLGKDYRSAFGVPVVNVPGCAPIGDNFTETVAAILYFLQGYGPLPEFDELGRPAWLFGETVHRHCVRGAYYEEGDYAEEFGDPECLVEIGCWGPVVNCNITSRGAINHLGGCMNSGGACIGCTMPGFPDKFTPFYTVAPGSSVSTMISRAVGRIVRPLRMYTNEHLNREVRWDLHHDTPSGWARQKPEPGAIKEAGHKFYDVFRRSSDGGKSKVPEWGKYMPEWTEAQEPEMEERLPGGSRAAGTPGEDARGE